MAVVKDMLYLKFSPKNGGKRCEGEEREYKLCNTGVSYSIKRRKTHKYRSVFLLPEV